MCQQDVINDGVTNIQMATKFLVLLLAFYMLITCKRSATDNTFLLSYINILSVLFVCSFVFEDLVKQLFYKFIFFSTFKENSFEVQRNTCLVESIWFI